MKFLKYLCILLTVFFAILSIELANGDAEKWMYIAGPTQEILMLAASAILSTVFLWTTMFLGRKIAEQRRSRRRRRRSSSARKS
jgi:preprotein translocase subunit SecG